MRSDRELLELAATAAGLEFHWIRLDSGWLMQASEPGSRSEESWNPLVNDGDALRLAVKLGIERIFVLRLGPNGVCVDGTQEPRTAPVFEHSSYRVVYDHYAATRRAIVRAAAEIAAQHPRTDGGGRE